MKKIWPFLLLWCFVLGDNFEPLNRALLDPEIAQIPDDIFECYTNADLWNRFSRLPNSLNSLVAILRKIELHPSVLNWTPGKLAATLIHRFRFDGILYDRCIDTSTGALPLKLDMQVEFPKMALIWKLISGDRDYFPDDAISPEEKCTLHWMLSYSVNTTFRDDEIFWTSEFEANNRQTHFTIQPPQSFGQERPPYGSNAWGGGEKQKSNRNCQDYTPQSLSPWEMGVVWSPSGPFTAGTMMSGLAAGLEPQSVSWSAGNMDNGYGAALAGDLGQTAIMKRRDEPYVGPDGFFNSTICPSEFYMRMVDRYQSFSRLTTAEINGGIDGLLLSQYAYEWERNTEYRLSQIVDMYYSPSGIQVQGSTPMLASCDRYANYYKLIPSDRLSDQAFIFGNELKNVLVLSFDETALRTSIAAAKERLDVVIRVLDQTLNDFGPCSEQRERDGYPVKYLSGYQPSPIDSQFLSSGIADVAVILDTTIISYEDEYFMMQVSAALANELDIWTTARKNDKNVKELVSGGSTLELLDGRYGKVIISTKQDGDFTNKAHLACQVLESSFPRTGTLDPSSTLEIAASRLTRKQFERQEDEISDGKALVILLVMFTRVATSDQEALNDAVYRLRRNYPSIHLLIATRWAPEDEFSKYVLFPDYDIFVLDKYNEELRAELDGRRIAKRIAQIPGNLIYTNCKDPENPEISESRSETKVYVIPDTQRFLRINPEYFLRTEELEVTFSVEYNAVDVCWSRAAPEEFVSGESFQDMHENDRNNDRESRKKNKKKEDEDQSDLTGKQCQSGSAGKKVKFRFENPCEGKSLTRCRPIFFRIDGKDAGGTRCLTEENVPCRTANSAFLAITHRGMQCGSSVIELSGALSLATLVYNLIKNISQFN